MMTYFPGGSTLIPGLGDNLGMSSPMVSDRQVVWTAMTSGS